MISSRGEDNLYVYVETVEGKLEQLSPLGV